MPENIEPLSGREIINDLLDKIEDKLKKDCNLRENDAYSRGYSAKVDIRIELYGLDTVKVDQTYEINTAKETPDAVVIEKFEVPVDQNIQAVRERSGQEAPDLARFEAPSEPNQTVVPAPLKRRYMRKPAGGMNEELA